MYMLYVLSCSSRSGLEVEHI